MHALLVLRIRAVLEERPLRVRTRQVVEREAEEDQSSMEISGLGGHTA